MSMAPAVSKETRERRVVTILFADLVGFTPLAERLDAEDVAAVQQALLALADETVGRWGGRVLNFMGDAVMAVYGVPRSGDDDAERAVRSGLALVHGLEQSAVQLEIEGELQLRVGINTGEVLSAVSSESIQLTGDAVNVAARLQVAAPPGGVLIGEATALAVADAIELVTQEPVLLKGKESLVYPALATGVRADKSREHALGGLRTRMLGRDADIIVADRAAKSAREFGTHCCVVVAPPGVGKTRLGEEFAARASVPVLRVRLRPDTRGPHDAVGQLIRDALRHAGVDLTRSPTMPGPQVERVRLLLKRPGRSVDRTLTLIEEMTVFVAPGSPRPPLVGDRAAVFDTWLEAIDGIAGDQGQDWLVEDVHWAAPDVLAFLEHAASSPCPGGRLLLCTARPALLEHAPAWGRADDDRTVLHLEPLSAADTRLLVHGLTGGGLPEHTVQLLAERSGGNPLFVEEALRMWIGVGLLELEAGRWTLRREVDEVSIPTTISSLYSAQLDDLPAPSRLAARRATVAGRRFPVAVLADLGVDDPHGALEVLERRALISEPVPDPLLGESHVFRHALLRDVGYATLPRRERTLLHHTMARWLESAAEGHGDTLAESIANHYEQAVTNAPALPRPEPGDLDKADTARRAAYWFERAGVAAMAVSAHDAARAFFRRALDWTPDDSILDNSRLWQALGEATAFAADMDEGNRAASQSLDLALGAYPESTDDERPAYRRRVADAAAALGAILLEQLRFDDAQTLADDTLGEIGDADDEATAKLLLLRANASWTRTNDSLLSLADRQRAIDLARRNGNRELELDAATAAVKLHLPEPHVLSVLDFERAEGLATTLRRWDALAGLENARAMLWLVSDRANDCAQPLRRANELSRTWGLAEEEAWTYYLQCETNYQLGRWAEAVEAGRLANAMAERYAYHRVAARTWAVLSEIFVETHDEAGLAECYEYVRPRRPHWPRSPFSLLMMAAWDLRFADAGLTTEFVPDPRVGLYGFDVALAQPSWFAAAWRVQNAWLLSGHLDAAADAIDRLHAKNMRWSSRFSRAVEALLRARLVNRREQDADTAAQFAGAALEAFRALPAPWWRLRALSTLEHFGIASKEQRDEATDIATHLGCRTS